MTAIRRLSAAFSAGAIAIGLASAAFGQADNTNSLIAPAQVPDYSQSDLYGASRQAWQREYPRSRLTPYEAERMYGYPYPYGYYYPHAYPYGYPASVDQGTVLVDPYQRSPRYFGGPGLAAGHDSNPNDYETGIYNPKP